MALASSSSSMSTTTTCACARMRTPASLSLLLALLLLVGCSYRMVGAQPQEEQQQQLLVLPSTCQTTVSSTKFFGARLDLYYFFLLEFYNTSSNTSTSTTTNSSGNEADVMDLSKIDRALATALVEYLDDCDEVSQQPLYGVMLSSDPHYFSPGDGYCEPLISDADTSTIRTTCRVTRGLASVLLNTDKEVNIVETQTAALLVMEQVLGDTLLLVDYTGLPLVRSEFLRSIGENVVVLLDDDDGASDNSGDPSDDAWSQQEPDTSSSRPTKIALAVCFCALFVAMVFLVGLYRKYHHRNNNANADPQQQLRVMRLGHYQAKRRRYFQQLHEHDMHRWMNVDGNISVSNSIHSLDDDVLLYEGEGGGGAAGALRGEGNNNSSSNNDSPKQASRSAWSVSDITSDSQSIRSSLPMDRIAEEEGSSSYHTDDDVEVPSNEGDDPLLDSHLKFIAHWKDGMEGITDEFIIGNDDMVLQAPFECADEEVTPIRRNHIDNFDDDCFVDHHHHHHHHHANINSVFGGCLYLLEDQQQASPDLDASNDTDPTLESPTQVPTRTLAPPSMSLSDEETRVVDHQLQHMPSEDLTWEQSLSIGSPVAASTIEEKSRKDVGSTCRDSSHVFRSKQAQQGSNTLLEDSVVAKNKYSFSDTTQQENRQPLAHHYNNDHQDSVVIEEDELEEGEELVLLLLLKSWAESVLQTLKQSRTQKRIGI